MIYDQEPTDHRFWLIPESQASAMYGYDSAFIGGTLSLPSFKHAFGLDTVSSAQLTALSSNIVSTFQAGAFFGCIVGFFTAERFGRKPIIMAAGVVFMIGVCLQMAGLIGLLYGGRVLPGHRCQQHAPSHLRCRVLAGGDPRPAGGHL